MCCLVYETSPHYLQVIIGRTLAISEDSKVQETLNSQILKACQVDISAPRGALYSHLHSSPIPGLP